MRTFRCLSGLIASALLCLPASLAAQQIRLSTIVFDLESPVFAVHAGDQLDRLFILEQAGIIKVRQPGQSTAAVFLDIRAKITSGGEQGLLGLAFHPQYATNGRFFVYYTRAGDGALVIAEYRATPANANAAGTAETVLLIIPHPVNTNHNGGMLAFGTDGYLYIGVGDGGGANDGPNNAQNRNSLLGKILRIDINAPDVAYVSPPTNPFAGVDGRDEIYAYGLRNPWRFSFDRETGDLWVGDVGQGAREEVDTPIVNGGNYGWRIFEGSLCTPNDPALCDHPESYLFPVLDYTHANGRCSLTGGYVYRGSEGAVPPGTYVYADYCSGEIFAWDGAAQSVLLDTTMNISSFGEDEHGELYVVDLGGSVSKLVRSIQCSYSISPIRAIYGRAGGAGTVRITTGAGCAWTGTSKASWITLTDGNSSGTGSGTMTYSVARYTGRQRSRTGTLTIAGKTFAVKQSR